MELFHLKYWYREEKTVIISSVHCGGYRVYIHLLPQCKCIALERQFVRIDLCSERTVAGKAKQGIRKAVRHDITEGRIDFSILQGGNHSAAEFRFEI